MPENAKVESFQCQNCGGSVCYDIAKQQFCCQSCGTPMPEYKNGAPVQEHPIDGFGARAQQGTPFQDSVDSVCATCGAHVVFDKHQTATVCPMCGSSQVSLRQLSAGVPPDGVIPFQVDSQKAQQLFKDWVKKRWFAPNRFKQAYQEGKLNGVYMPFWTYDAQAQAHFTGQGGKHYTVKDKDGKSRTETRWSFVSGHVRASYNDIQVCASDNEQAKVVDKIKPYNTIGNTRPYAPAYLAGFSAERYAHDALESFSEASDYMERDLRSRAESDILMRGFDVANITSLDASYENVTYKNVLLPAWLSAFFYNGKQYLYMINGETGRVGGQRPYSAPKIITAVLVAIAIIMTVFILGQEADAAEYATYDGAPTAASQQIQPNGSQLLIDAPDGEVPDESLMGVNVYGVVWTGQGYY